jgi:hypothetical protein
MITFIYDNEREYNNLFLVILITWNISQDIVIFLLHLLYNNT